MSIGKAYLGAAAIRVAENGTLVAPIGMPGLGRAGGEENPVLLLHRASGFQKDVGSASRRGRIFAGQTAAF